MKLAIRVAFCVAPISASATVACSVSGDAADGGAGLYRSADPAAKVIRTVPAGDLVFLPDESLAPALAEGWAWIRHDVTQSDIWNSGDYGWMKSESLAECG